MQPADMDIGEVRAFLHAKHEARAEELSHRLTEARRDAARILHRIIAEVKPLRVYQWGSLVTGRHFSQISDIDLALEGLAGPAEYFAALGIAMDETSFPVDIIEIEKLDSDTRDRIVNHGKLVYERLS